MTEAFGVEPINKGEGGSIPFIPELQRIFPNAQGCWAHPVPQDPKANATAPMSPSPCPASRTT